MGLQLSFDITGVATFIGWAVMSVGLFIPSHKQWHKRSMFLSGRLIPIALVMWFVGAGYAASTIQPQGDMFTLEGVIARFSVPDRLLVIWVEILAYDLLLGRWIADDALARGWSPFAILPLLPLTFIRGPLGLLVYLILLGLGVVMSKLRRWAT